MILEIQLVQDFLQETLHMKRLGILFLALVFVSAAYAADVAVSALHGTIKKVDSAGKTVVVATADGTEKTLHVGKETAVHGVDAADKGAKDSWNGLKDGTEVVAHYTKKGSEDSAVEIDKVGKDGLKATEGTVKEVDRGGKKIVITAADGTDHTFHLTDHAAKDSGEGIEKGTKVVVYSTEDAGKKVGHFFEKI
jgi:hypothetical protein